MVQQVWSPVYVDALVLRDRDSTGDGNLNERLWVQQDANWNVTALLDNNGNVVERNIYDPFGVASTLAPDWTSRASSLYAWVYLFQGTRYDSSSGLDDMRGRVYSPTLGRFGQNDPSGLRGGDANLYRALANNATNLIDPTGLAASGWQQVGQFVNGLAGPRVRVEDFPAVLPQILFARMPTSEFPERWHELFGPSVRVENFSTELANGEVARKLGTVIGETIMGHVAGRALGRRRPGQRGASFRQRGGSAAIVARQGARLSFVNRIVQGFQSVFEWAKQIWRQCRMASRASRAPRSELEAALRNQARRIRRELEELGEIDDAALRARRERSPLGDWNEENGRPRGAEPPIADLQGRLLEDAIIGPFRKMLERVRQLREQLADLERAIVREKRRNGARPWNDEIGNP